MRKNLFITFEGSEGCGKSTQIKRLLRRLEAMGIFPVLTREPGGTPIGEEIKKLLQFSDAGKAMKAEAELLLFTASRAQLVRELIQPALQAGKMVIADRFLDSTTVYQGVARKIAPETVRAINLFAVGDCIPDITFILDLDPNDAQHRLTRRAPPAGVPDRMEQEPLSFYEAVRNGYLAVAAAEPERTRLIHAGRPEDEVEEEIWRHLQERFDGIHTASRI